MDTESQKMFDIIIAKDQDSLSEEEKGFLMARRGYFNDEQRKRYADMIKLHEAGKLFKAEKSLSEMSLAELKAEAKERGVDIKGLKNAKEILSAIEDSEDEE